MAVNGASTSSGATIQQWDDNGTPDHEWRFLPIDASPTDVTAPAMVNGLIATANAVSVQLQWNPSAAVDLAGYTVLRAAISGGPYEIAARGLTTNSFTDKFANQPKDYFYVVKAVDKSYNSSGNSAEVVARPTGNAGLVARYSFDGGFADGSINGNHPIVTNGTPAFVAGKFGSAMDFDGTSQYAMLPANLFASVTNFTIACWVNWDGGGAWQRIFDFGNDTTQYMFLSPSSGSGTLRFAVTTNGNGAEQILETSPLPVGQWRHVAVTRAGNIARLYVNGALAVSNTNVVTVAPASFNPVLNYVGKSQWPDPLFNGRLDELFIYNYALSDTEISRLANDLPPPPVAPTILSAVFSENMLNLSWPLNYLGCRLQVQTNALSDGLEANWTDVPGSNLTNGVALPVDQAVPTAFYRLVYP